MPQGMVTSLVFINEKYLKYSSVDRWVIVDLSHLKYIRGKIDHKQSEYPLLYEGVKEQRVDGSSKSSYVGDFVRCTLVAGKPVFGRKIHIHSYKTNLKNFSNIEVTNLREGGRQTRDIYI